MFTVSLFDNIVTLLTANDKMETRKDFLDWGREVIEKEASAITNLAKHLDDDFSRACELLFHCQGRVIVTGLGKSGHVGKKIAATLASTGSPAFFVHAAEASHGDFGMITNKDIVLAISNSGKTQEIILLLPLLQQLQIPLISFTGDAESALARQATVNLNTHVTNEAGPLDLAPTSSTTACLALGDALAIALLRARDFKREDFARSHPGGTLGKRLLVRVDHLMHAGNDAPRVLASTSLKQALLEMSSKHLGMTTVVDNDDKLLGIFTDGDVRRALENDHNIMDTSIDHLMTSECLTTSNDRLAFEVFSDMEQRKITAMPVVDDDNCVIGVIHLHDILQAGII